MISVEQALSLLFQYKKDFGTEEVDLLQSAGRILAQNVVADRDFPPYHRVTMDGIAIKKEAFDTGNVSFYIENIQAAGTPQLNLQQQNNCIEVMTGAVLPNNTDAVIPYEDCEITDNIATIRLLQIKHLQNIHQQGSDAKKGDVLLKKGIKITPSHIAILATVGYNKVLVLKLPAIAICSTGNELVNIDEIPQSHQIRMSNSYMLAAALQEENILPALFHLPDDKEIMTSKLSELKQQFDVIILSGAVSKGKYDFIPAVLESLGMKTIFHRVAQKPGKPVLFGVFENDKMVFGLPGNPVSSLVCYHLYVKRWLQDCLQINHLKVTVALAENVQFTPRLSYHLLISLYSENGTFWAKPLQGTNSGDIPSLINAEAIITLPSEKEAFAKGDIFEIQSWLTHF